MYFTTVTKLRASPAEQSRVDNVERRLLAIRADWKSDWPFPIAAIYQFNGSPDMNWVVDEKQTHVVTGFDAGVTAKLNHLFPKDEAKDVYRNPVKILQVIDDLLAQANMDWRTVSVPIWTPGDAPGVTMYQPKEQQSTAEDEDKRLTERLLSLGESRLRKILLGLNVDNQAETGLKEETETYVSITSHLFKTK